ncbi:integrase [Pullulanibacillus pueri]|uniref:Integrase n=1 Tax=Pullulanibacillus pueri TaxID=1437324 RepID=A0A8J3EMI1_9BACL|nr:site-specific integrase [Pullulanibacillus pueri]MBM7681987.1 integrase [Pullulanibacillus pueri]GGH83670.1 integrase [Pullulanibacillus pueri]
MASFQKRGKTWQYTISRTVAGKSKPIRKGGFRTKKEAAAAAGEIEAELRKGVVPHLKLEPFDAYFESWLNIFKTNIAKNTLERYKNTLKTVQNYFGDKPIQEINKRSYQEFLNLYAQDHAKDSTKKLNTHIRACVRNAIDEGIIRVDFTRGAVLTGNKESKRPEEKHLHYDESQKLLKELYNRLDRSPTYYLLLLALTTGCRFAELVGLQRKDFNFVTNSLSITKTWGYTKKMPEGFGPTKNEQSVRTIKVDKKTMKIFNKWFDETPENILKLVFYSPQSKYKVISNGVANKVLKSTLESLKISPISVHGLRHTHASILLYRQVSIYYVAERLGHANTETTIRNYAHIIKEMRKQDEALTTNIFEAM